MKLRNGYVQSNEPSVIEARHYAKAGCAATRSALFEDTVLRVQRAVRKHGPWATAIRLQDKSFIGREE